MGLNLQFQQGATRFVICIGKVAIKLPRLLPWRNFLQGFLANLQEREFNTLRNPNLAKVLYSDPIGLVVVMERADDEDLEPFLVRAFLRECQKQNLPVDYKASSVGKFGNKFKLIDYGS